MEKPANIELLIHLCKTNNKNAQFEIYKLYNKAMFNISYRIVNQQDIAEDVMQESFLAAFTKLNSFSGNVTFGSWLKKIVVNNSITALQKKNKYIFTNVEDNKDVKLVEEENSNEEFKNLKVDKVVQAMKKLKEDYRIILSLHYIEGYDLEEITDILKITYENCRTKLSRAKESLRQKINE